MEEFPETIMEEDIVEIFDPILQLPAYVAPRKSSVKVPKDLDKVWSFINMSFLPEKFLVEGDMFEKILLLKMDDWGLEN